MEVFIIAIVMWWGDPLAKPLNDSVEIETLHGKPLYFETQQECFDHVDENLEALKGFGRAYFQDQRSQNYPYCQGQCVLQTLKIQ